MLAKKFNDIKSNLESIGLFIEKVMPRKADGQHYSIKHSKSSTLSTHLHKPSNNEGLGNVDDSVNDVEGNAITGASTSSKALVSAGCVDDVNDVDKTSPFAEGWATVTDEELPPEFLEPTPPKPSPALYN